jgi:carbamoyl-phosphate synthase large subunit
MKNGEVTLMMVTSSGDEPDLRDGRDLRRLALTLQVCCCLPVVGRAEGKTRREDEQAGGSVK